MIKKILFVINSLDFFISHRIVLAEEWKRTLYQLLQAGTSYREAMGRVGRSHVEDWYSLQAQAPRLLNILKNAVH